MEAKRGAGVVSKHQTAIPALEPSSDLATHVRLSEVLHTGLRLEASAFNIEARAVQADLHACGLPLAILYGDTGLCQECHNAFRFRRIWVDAAHGEPFLSSSDIISLRPEPKGYLSRKLSKKLDELKIQPWDVLISRSGTIGNVGLASPRIAGMLVSEDVIRVRAPDHYTAGYIAAYLRSRVGRLLMRQATYGSVVQHIEPDHLTHVLIPDLAPIRRTEVGRKMIQAYQWRDDANALLDEADALLHRQLGLPYLTQTINDGPTISTTRASRLLNRFEGSFHALQVQAAERQLAKLGCELTTLGDERVMREIRAVTKFRKRIYIPKGGIPLLSSKQLFQIDPIDIKGLAKGAHTKDMEEFGLATNMIAVTCSGTIGRVQIIPAYMNGWAANQHAIRLTASELLNPGYIYAWLSSDYGQTLITRFSYGSVILEIDRWMLRTVPIPLPGSAIENEIGDLILKANALRTQAWNEERAAIEEISQLIRKPEKTRPLPQ